MTQADHTAKPDNTCGGDISGENFITERAAHVKNFVKTHPEYYITQFGRIGNNVRFVPTFNLWAGLLGPIWFSARGLWNWGLTFLLIEIFALVQIFRGLFGDLAADARARIERIKIPLPYDRNNWQQPSNKLQIKSTSINALSTACKAPSVASVWKHNRSKTSVYSSRWAVW